MIAPFTTCPRTILGIVGVLYIVLGVFCSLDPMKLGEAMGYSFKGNGKIEFVVIYGGLEIGFGLVMLIAAMNQVLFPGVYFMTTIVSLALPLARILMLIPGKIEGKMSSFLIIELAILAALSWPLLRKAMTE